MAQFEFMYGMTIPSRDFSFMRLLLQQSMISNVVEFDKYISRIVEDAKSIVESSENISKIDREFYNYSVYLGEKGRSWITDLDPNDLKKEDYKKILEVFEKP